MDVESVADATAEDAVKILQIISGLGVNGALVYCKFLSRQLVEQGHDVTILCRPNSWIASQTNEPFKVKTSALNRFCLLYTSPSPRDATLSRMPSSA